MYSLSHARHIITHDEQSSSYIFMHIIWISKLDVDKFCHRLEVANKFQSYFPRFIINNKKVSLHPYNGNKFHEVEVVLTISNSWIYAYNVICVVADWQEVWPQVVVERIVRNIRWYKIKKQVCVWVRLMKAGREHEMGTKHSFNDRRSLRNVYAQNIIMYKMYNLIRPFRRPYHNLIREEKGGRSISKWM